MIFMNSFQANGSHLMSALITLREVAGRINIILELFITKIAIRPNSHERRFKGNNDICSGHWQRAESGKSYFEQYREF
jgi:hypothetical protein